MPLSNSTVFREKIGYSKVIMLQEEYDVFNDINHTLEPDFNSMFLYYLGMIDSTLPSPDAELEEFTVSPNEAVLQKLEADHEPLDDSFQIICIRSSSNVEPDEQCELWSCFSDICPDQHKISIICFSDGWCLTWFIPVGIFPCLHSEANLPV